MIAPVVDERVSLGHARGLPADVSEPVTSPVALWLSRIIFAGLLLLPILSAIPYGSVEPWWDGVSQGVIFGLGALWVVEGWVAGKWFTSAQKVVAPFALLAGFAFLQSISLPAFGTISLDPFSTRVAAVKLVSLAILACLYLRHANSERRVRLVLWSVITVALLSSAFGIIRQTTQHAFLGFFLPFLRKGAGYGQFINQNHFALLAEMGLGVVLGLVSGKTTRREVRLIYLGLGLPIWVGLILSASRGGLMGMFAQLSCLPMIFLLVRSRSKAGHRSTEQGSFLQNRALRLVSAAIITVGLLLTVLVGVVWVGGERVVDRIDSIKGEITVDESENSTLSRKEIWEATSKLISDHPLSGVGFGSFDVAIQKYHQGAGNIVPGNAHNDYLELMADGGLVAVGLLCLGLSVFGIQVTRLLKAGSSEMNDLRIAALLGLVGVMVHNFVDFGLHIPSNTLAFIALASAACSRVRPRQRAAKKLDFGVTNNR